MKRLLPLVALLLFGFNIHASLLNDRFAMIKNDEGEITAVRARFIPKKYNVDKVFSALQADVQDTQVQLAKKSVELQNQIDDLVATYAPEGNKSVANFGPLIRQAINDLLKLDREHFNDPRLKKFLADLKWDLDRTLLTIRPDVVASLDDPNYFFRRKIINEVFMRALNFAKKSFAGEPIIHTAIFIIEELDKLIKNQRAFSQNLLVELLQSSTAEELGISVDEINRIMSSIYESKIGLIDMATRNRAREQWQRFGWDQFYTDVRSADRNLRNSRFSLYSQRYNHAFMEVEEDGRRKIINLIHKRNQFSAKFATAFFFDQPNKIMIERTLLNLATFGLRFINVGGFIRGNLTNFLKSIYVEQSILEGMLIAYFEKQRSAPEITRSLLRQSRNPLIML